MPTSSLSRRRPSSARQVLAVVTAAYVVIQTVAFIFNAAVPAAHANNTPQPLTFVQNWSDTTLISANDNWSNVPGIVGFLGDYTTGTPENVNPGTLTQDMTTVDVIANQTTPNTNTAGGVAEFHSTQQAAPNNSNPTIALQGSGTADAPNIVLYLNTTGRSGVNVSYSLRDIDCSADNAAQQVALQYRVGSTGNFTNLPAGYIADATSRASTTAGDVANCTQVTPVSVTLPSDANHQPVVQVRIMTTNASTSDEWVGVDDITVTGASSLAVSDATVLEGDSGTATASFTVSLPENAGPGGVTFDICTADDTAQDDNPNTEDNDYQAKCLTGQSIPEGSKTYQFDVSVNGDTAVEVNETFFVNLTNVTGAAVVDSQGVGTIQNDDSPPDLSVIDVAKAETNSGTHNFNFTVALSAPARAGGVTFDICTADDTATAGSDYVSNCLTGQTIPEGQNNYFFTVVANGDTTFEANESFFVNVTNVTGANPADPQGVGTLTNDDAQPTISINDAAVTEGDAGTSVMTFTVTLSNPSQPAVSVQYATADAGATAGSDYVAVPATTLNFASGDTSETFDVTVNGDTDAEGDEMLVVNLSAPSGATVADGQGQGTIRLDDPFSLNAIGTPFAENFDVLAQTGTSSTTPPVWTRAESGANANNTYTANNGGSNSGDTYSYGATGSSDRALGGLQSGSLVPTFGAFYRNDTGTNITSLAITYTGEQWRLGATGRADRLDFQYSTDAASLTTGTWANFDPLDFTSPFTSSTSGDVGLRDGNAAANRATRSNTVPLLNIPAGATFWIRWTDFNASGADDGLAVDDFSITAQTGGPTDAAPAVSSTSPSDNSTGSGLNGNVQVTFNEPVAADLDSFAISCATSGAHAFALTGGPTTYTLDPNTDFSPNEVCTVTVFAEQISDVDTDDPPDNMSEDYTFDFTTADTSVCGSSFTPIYVIQGSAASSPMDDAAVTTEGVVTASFLGTGINGYYIQDTGGDGNTDTSDGVFVFDGSYNAPVAVGDRVRVSGTVDEFNGLTEITNTTSVVVCSTGNAVAATVVDLPEAVNGDLERYENMLTTFPETLTVSGNFTLGRFGELVLSSDGRMFQQNNFARPNSPAALAAADLNERRYILLDDGNTAQDPDPTPYFDANNTRRVGDTVTGLTGVLTFAFSEYRVQPTAAPNFVSANPRTAAPASVGGNVKASSFNVLNYFNGDGSGGGFPTSRGANSLAEFQRQRSKIIAAMTAIDADVFGVIEIENDGNGPQSAIQDLVNGLNDATAPGTYAFREGTTPGTDAIKNSIVYKTSVLTPVGDAVNDDNAAWTGQARNPLAQTFQLNSNGEKFTFIVNHFTSKGCSGSDTGDDADTGDGQGCDNGTRTRQSERLLVFIQDRKTAAGDADVLAMGDLNAYGDEDPIFALEQDAADSLADGPGGLVNQVERFVPAASRYSYQFDSQSGYLDHALTTRELSPRVSGTTIWHINADEPTYIDYNVEFKSASQQAINQGTPYRSSDHDPVIVGLNLTPGAAQAAGSLIISEFRLRGPGPAPTPGTTGENDEFIEFYNNTDSDIVVQAADGSQGYALVTSVGGGTINFIIPNDEVIPARGHYLAVNDNGYTLSSYASPDLSHINGIPDNVGIALFNTSNPVNFTLDNRLDAAGPSSETNELFREGTGYPPLTSNPTVQFSFYRDLSGDTPKDTGVNSADFLYVSTDGGDAGAGSRLGAPGPENQASPIQRNGSFGGRLLDSQKSQAAPPNRERDPNDTDTNATFGTLTIRRRIVNNTEQNVVMLRFRVINISTFPQTAPGAADLRVLSSSAVEISNIMDADTCAAADAGPPPCTVDMSETILEEPPAQPSGGGFNSSLVVRLTAGMIPPGESVNVAFRLGVMQPGRFKFYVNLEAITEPAVETEAPFVTRRRRKK